MAGYRDASIGHSLLVILSLASLLPFHTPIHVGSQSPEDREKGIEEWRSTLQEEVEVIDDKCDDDELFGDMDPKTLAAVLLEALNNQPAERRREGRKEEEEEGMTTYQNVEQARVSSNLARDGREDVKLVMAAKAPREKEEQNKEEEEREKAKEEEEKLTEKVTSHITSQTVPMKAEVHSATPYTNAQVPGKQMGVDEEVLHSTAQSPNTPTHPQHEEMQHNEEEEQLSPDELRSLETMMKEFQSFSTASKQERDSLGGRRESRGYAPYNDVVPKNNGYDLAMSKKKLKWQEETQKAMNAPTFLGGNFMDDFEEHLHNVADSTMAQPLSPSDSDLIKDDEPEEAEEDEALSPEEEEAWAKAEQEEVQWQAAEVQKAKMEEEKLADIASDMLLQYIARENSRIRKYREKNRKYSSTAVTSMSNTAEDKRSDEEQITEEDDVKLFSSTRGSQILTSQPNSLLSSKQAPPAVNPLKVWFQDKQPLKLSLANQDLLLQTPKSQSTNQSYMLKLQKPLSNNPDVRLKSQKSIPTNYLPYSPFRSFYPKKPYKGYYPILYFSPELKPHYYIPKPALTLGNFGENSYKFPPKQYFRNWMQPRLRKPPASFKNAYYTNSLFSSYPRTFQPFPFPKKRSPTRLPGFPSQQSEFYYSPLMPIVARDDYYGRNQADKNNEENLERLIQQILTKRPFKFK